MDTRGLVRDTRGVAALGRSRQRLAGVLNAAFAEGLLSEQTHSYRLGLLFGPRLIDQQRLVGDLTLRRGHARTRGGVRDAWAALAESVRTLSRRGGPSAVALLLALDWAESDRLLLGRHPACDIVLSDPSVSRRHAQLTFRGGVWVIQDLASTNGTAINGAQIGRAALHAGDILTLGSQPVQID
jgi:FHA domain